MIRVSLIFFLLISCAELVAQRDSSLTEEFGKLSAKQRTKIAQQEEKDAANDLEFKQLMAEAENLFQQKAYDEALSVFKQARKKRPYNVHPKVKIQDLEAFIKERDNRSAVPAVPIKHDPIQVGATDQRTSVMQPDPPHPKPIATLPATPGVKKAPVESQAPQTTS